MQILQQLLTVCAGLALLCLTACNTISPDAALTASEDGRTYILSADDGRRLKITAHGDAMIRLQSVKPGEKFTPDDRYEMVLTHDWDGALQLSEPTDTRYVFSTGKIDVKIDRETLRASFQAVGDDAPLLEEITPVQWSGTQISAHFAVDDTEHFTGLGHSFYGREASLDLRGQRVSRNYGGEQIEQAPLIVPFYMSSKGYGVFLNSTFPNEFSFGANGQYTFGIDGHGFGGQMDYFFIAGPSFPEMLDNYTQLTGRPRLPMKSMFGLQLSDKGHDHTTPTPSDEAWWRSTITAHRAAGFPLDHVVNDNRWRAAGGQRCVSKLAWDSERYPDPAAYGTWLEEEGLVITLDFNRCIAKYTEGWRPEFNLPTPGSVDFSDSAPDLTNPDFRKWFWSAFYENALDPSRDFPGDALWIDEFDEQGAAPLDQILHNGASSAEMRNYWFFLIAKSLVQEGWDQSGIQNRPFVWVRGMTAGAQRYATLWSGDIYPNYDDMQGQIRAMQLAGLSGFPFWGHDAGGFYDWDAGLGPDETLYQQWGMALGAFSPIWKPHGMGQSRWPLDRSEAAQETALRFSRLRYELMPYTYTMAHRAAETGTPIIRPMMFDAPQSDEAWARDLQFMWGDSLLIAPQTNASGTVDVWLPEGDWYEFNTLEGIMGNQTLTLDVSPETLPIYAKAGSIIPFRDYAQSTAFIDKSHLGLTVFRGQDGRFELIEDDDRTEAYRQGAVRRTEISYDDAEGRLLISADGDYAGAVAERRYTVQFVGGHDISSGTINGEPSTLTRQGTAVTLQIPAHSVDQVLEIMIGP